MAALQEFINYNFDNDSKFSEYLNGLEFSKYPIGFILKKIQMKYFCRHVNRNIKYDDLLNQYMHRNDNQSSSTSQGNPSNESNSTYSQQNSSSSTHQPQYQYQAGNRVFVPLQQNVNAFAMKDRSNILMLQIAVFILGPLSLFFAGRFYLFFCILSVLANGQIAYLKTRSWKKFLLLEERGHYALLSLFMIMQPVSILYIILMMMVACLDIVDFSPSVLSGISLYQQRVSPLLQTVNQHRFKQIEMRIPLLEIMIYFSSLLQLKPLRILMMLNLLTLRYIHSNNLSIVLDVLVDKIEQYTSKVPVIHNAIIFVKKYIGIYVQNLREAHSKLKVM